MSTQETSSSRKGRTVALLIVGVLIALACGAWAVVTLTAPTPTFTAAVSLDREETQENGAALNASTQSVNRYHSVIRDLDTLEVSLPDRRGRVSLKLHQAEGDKALFVDNVDITYLTPLLPYPLPSDRPDDFDKANLMLAEYARNGVELSYQESNTRFGVFYGGEGLFDGEAGEEYFFEDGELKPNPRLRPKRFSVTNNCLTPGLWEVSASDSVGEMYHGWVTIPDQAYLSMVRSANGLEIPDEELKAGLTYRKDFGSVYLSLDRLRDEGELLFTETPKMAETKKLGGYSTQDSRRKVQRGFFKMYRGEEPLEAKSFADLTHGDVFTLHAFIPPGIYTFGERQVIPFDPHWERAEIREVVPKTRYPGEHKPAHGDFGHVEIAIFAADGKRSIVVGNIPVALLVLQEDYSIPAFGVGVLDPSEPIERRYLRLREGPAPHYAYLVEREGDRWRVLNNHEFGQEQVFLRPFERAGDLFLRFTIVAYERIVDLLELEIPLHGELAERISKASSIYHPPLYRVYKDENIL